MKIYFAEVFYDGRSNREIRAFKSKARRAAWLVDEKRKYGPIEIYRLTEWEPDNWWPDCFWVKLSLLAKERRVSMRSPDKMAALVAELEGTYGEVILSDWPWVKQMQERRRANGAST
jgi:hypothetical protein